MVTLNNIALDNNVVDKQSDCHNWLQLPVSEAYHTWQNKGPKPDFNLKEQ